MPHEYCCDDCYNNGPKRCDETGHSEDDYIVECCSCGESIGDPEDQ